VTSNVHIDGYGDDHEYRNVNKTTVPGDPYEEFHTYGLLWTENSYSFYIDGIRAGVSTFGGASMVPEFMLISVEVGGENAVPGDSWSGDIRKNDILPSEFVIDYVRVYDLVK